MMAFFFRRQPFPPQRIEVDAEDGLRKRTSTPKVAGEIEQTNSLARVLGLPMLIIPTLYHP